MIFFAKALFGFFVAGVAMTIVFLSIAKIGLLFASLIGLAP